MEGESEGEDSFFYIPDDVKKIGSILLVLLLLFCAVTTIFYVICPTSGLKIHDLGLPSLTIFSLIGLFILHLPWKKYELTLLQLSFLGFAKRQNDSHRELNVDLIKRIEKLENGSQLTTQVERKKVSEQLIKFLTDRQIATSPKMIEKLTTSNPEYNAIQKNETLVRSELQKLVIKGELETRVSKKGNTLYKIK